MRSGKLALVLGLGLLIGSPALAQQPGGFGGFGGGFGARLTGMIGQNKQLQYELKMDKDQVDKLTEALAKVREDLRDETAKLRDRNLPQDERTAITKKTTAWPSRLPMQPLSLLQTFPPTSLLLERAAPRETTPYVSPPCCFPVDCDRGCVFGRQR